MDEDLGGMDDGSDDLDTMDDDAPPLPPKAAVKGSKVTQSKDKKKKSGGSTLVLWLLLLLFLLAGSAGGLYLYQDMAIKYWPPLEEYLIQAHVRHERPGAGFEIKRLGEIERVVRDNTEVVIIRGIIVNVSNRTRPVPPMKLVLLDKDGHSRQEKTDKPPVASLDPGATASFKIQLERPDAEARSIVLEFVEMPEPPPPAESPVGDGEKHDADKSSGGMTPPPVPAADPVPAVTQPAPAAAQPAADPPPAPGKAGGKAPASAHKK